MRHWETYRATECAAYWVPYWTTFNAAGQTKGQLVYWQTYWSTDGTTLHEMQRATRGAFDDYQEAL